MNQSRQLRKYTHKKLQTALKYDNKLARYSEKHDKTHHGWVLCNLAQNNLSSVLHLVQVCDYSVIYFCKSLKDTKQQEIFVKFVEFLGMNTSQMHTALLANKHLSSTDKLIGAMLDTYAGFLYVTFPKLNKGFFKINLNIISEATRIPLDQVKKSVHQLGKYAHYFDNSTHPEDNL